MYAYALFGAFVLLLVGFVADTYTTLRGIHRGEVNPVMGFLMSALGVRKALLLSKLAFLGVAIACAALLPGSWYVVTGIYIVAGLHILAAVINEAR